jgi:hypothetical protein
MRCGPEPRGGISVHPWLYQRARFVVQSHRKNFLQEWAIASFSRARPANDFFHAVWYTDASAESNALPLPWLKLRHIQWPNLTHVDHFTVLEYAQLLGVHLGAGAKDHACSRCHPGLIAWCQRKLHCWLGLRLGLELDLIQLLHNSAHDPDRPCRRRWRPLTLLQPACV